MAYIGAEPVPGQNREVDDISSSFNGSTTAFTLQVSGVNVSPESANNILVNLGGVLQNPGTDYTIAASTITFTTAPASGLSFFALVLGAGINTATVADGTIGSSKLLDTAVTAGSYTTADITVNAKGQITAASSGSISNAEIANNAVTTAKIADSTGASDGVTTAKIATSAITTAKIADQAVDLSKLPHGTSSNDGKFLRANNGADPSFETVSSVGGATGVDFNDNIKARFGTGNDLEIFHSGSHSQIVHNGTGNVFLDSIGGTVNLRAGDNAGGVHNSVVCNLDAGVELYHNNSKKFETTASGGTLSGTLSFPDGDAGTNTEGGIKLGASGDLHIYHDGNNSHIKETGTGDLIITGKNNITFLDYGTNETMAKMTSEGAVELYHDNSKKLETASGGIVVTGTIGNDGIYMGDGEKALFGNSDDLRIFHESGLGNVFDCKNANSFLVINDRAGGNETMIKAVPNGEVELYHNNNIRFNTNTSGTILTGSATGFAHIMRNTRANTDISGLNIDFGQGGSNNNQRHFLACTDQSATRALIDADGGMRNVTGSYGSISDVTLKENIVDAPSQWDDIKNIKIRNFNFKASSGHDTTKKIGVIAQELETVCPNLVESTYKDGEDTGKKSVKSSILYMKAIKALQEAITKIETLETKVAALEAA